jgi:hypothetical protein
MGARLGPRLVAEAGEQTLANPNFVLSGLDQPSIIAPRAAMTATATSLAQCRCAQAQTRAVPLASWNDGPAKQAIPRLRPRDHGTVEQGFRLTLALSAP